MGKDFMILDAFCRLSVECLCAKVTYGLACDICKVLHNLAMGPQAEPSPSRFGWRQPYVAPCLHTFCAAFFTDSAS